MAKAHKRMESKGGRSCTQARHAIIYDHINCQDFVYHWNKGHIA